MQVSGARIRFAGGLTGTGLLDAISPLAGFLGARRLGAGGRCGGVRGEGSWLNR
jgi:hypothetical protein